MLLIILSGLSCVVFVLAIYVYIVSGKDINKDNEEIEQYKADQDKEMEDFRNNMKF